MTFGYTPEIMNRQNVALLPITSLYVLLNITNMQWYQHNKPYPQQIEKGKVIFIKHSKVF